MMKKYRLQEWFKVMTVTGWKDGFLEPTPENIEIAKEFVLEKWKERHVEKYGNTHPMPTDLSYSCKFSSLFALAVFGGRLRGNYHHQFVVLKNKTIIDLNENAEDVRKLGALAHHHSSAFFMSRDHRMSLDSCFKRVEEWLNEFKASLTHSPSF